MGKTEPRLWTQPLRELTPETTLGFELIDFAEQILRKPLRPWQKWLAIHALELNVDGTYRFRRVIVAIARQNGKSFFASVLAAWWLFVDSARHPDRVPPVDFKIVGTAQNLDIAREPWSSVKLWCDPEPDTDAARSAAVPALQGATAKVSDTNGKEFILGQSLAHYEIRAAKNARGKPAARVLMDELREQQTWVAWNAVSQTTKSFWSGQLWGISNAGDALSVVLAKQRDAALELIDEWDRYVTAGLLSAEEYANGNHDIRSDCSSGPPRMAARLMTSTASSRRIRRSGTAASRSSSAFPTRGRCPRPTTALRYCASGLPRRSTPTSTSRIGVLGRCRRSACRFLSGRAPCGVSTFPTTGAMCGLRRRRRLPMGRGSCRFVNA